MKKTPEEILETHLKECFETHGEKIPDVYHGYLLRSMKEYAEQGKFNKNNLIARLIAFPFIYLIIFIRYNFHCFRHSYLVFKYGGEWITYTKDDKKTIQDVYMKVKEIVK